MAPRPGRTAARRLLLVVLAAAAAGLGACAEPRGTAATTTTASTSTVPPETTTTAELPLAAGRPVTLYVPEVGDCFDRRRAEGLDPQTGQPRDPDEEVALELDCNLPHTFEVFAVVDIPPAEGFPGEPALVDLGKAWCPKSFGDYVGAPYETSELEMAYYVPSGRTWPDLGRKVVGCTVRAPEGKLTGTVRGSGR